MKCNVDYESAKKTCANRSLYLRQEKAYVAKALSQRAGHKLNCDSEVRAWGKIQYRSTAEVMQLLRCDARLAFRHGRGMRCFMVADMKIGLAEVSKEEK